VWKIWISLPSRYGSIFWSSRNLQNGNTVIDLQENVLQINNTVSCFDEYKKNVNLIIGRGGLQACKAPRIPYVCDNKLRDGSRIVSLKRRSRFTPYEGSWYSFLLVWVNLFGPVTRVHGYGSRGPGFDSRHYQIFWGVVGLERGTLSLVRIIEELLERKVAAPN
jgi:hypothetical protein